MMTGNWNNKDGLLFFIFFSFGKSEKSQNTERKMSRALGNPLTVINRKEKWILLRVLKGWMIAWNFDEPDINKHNECNNWCGLNW